jgi:hypothetical protein
MVYFMSKYGSIRPGGRQSPASLGGTLFSKGKSDGGLDVLEFM